MEPLDVSFPSGGVRCAGRLYRAAGGSRRPVVVLGHGLGATMDLGLAAYAERFAEAGFHALAFDYRGFGRSGGTPRQWLDVRRQVADWRAALAYSRLLHDGDSRRIAIWGSSFGGGHVIRVAAREPVAAAIAMCPFTSGPASAKALGALTSAKLLPGALRDAATARTRRGAHGVALFGPPRAAALMNSPDAEPGMRALIPEGVDFDERIDGRIALHLPYQLPGRHTRRIPAPILFVVCDHDTLTPAETTVKYAERAPRGEIKRYPAGHFDVFQGPVFERMVADQVDFLTRHLG